MSREIGSKPTGISPSASSILEQIGHGADVARRDVERAVEDLVTYLASPRGKALRSKLAMGVIAVAPVIARAPIVRRNPLLKLLGVAGFATLLVKLAERVRDWEPQQATPAA